MPRLPIVRTTLEPILARNEGGGDNENQCDDIEDQKAVAKAMRLVRVAFVQVYQPVADIADIELSARGHSAVSSWQYDAEASI